MRKSTIRKGLRFLIAALLLLLLGTYYGQQINAFLPSSLSGSTDIVKLSFLWGTILGVAGIITITFGLLARSRQNEKFSLLPTIILLTILVMTFFTLFYRALSAPPDHKPLKPGETIVI